MRPISVTAYANGKLSSEEMNKRLTVYGGRWGDAMRGGVQTEDGMTDNELVTKIDAALRARLVTRGRTR